jgi:site-specific DNA recombinase
MLKGLLRCGKCGRNMYGRTRTNKKDNYYMCSSKRIKTENCGNRSINIDFLENWLFSKFFLDYSLYKKVKEYLGSLDTIDSKTSLEAEIKELTNKFNQVERKINKLILLAEEDTLTDAEIKHRISALRSEKNDLTIKLNNSNNQLKLIAINNSNDLLKGLKVKSSLSFNDKRKILNSYIKNIKIEFIDNYYKIDIEWNILGYRDKVYLVHKSYGHYIYNDIEYSLKENKEKTTLERVLKNLKKYDKPPREK